MLLFDITEKYKTANPTQSFRNDRTEKEMLELTVIDISESKPKSLYARQFNIHPRIGEWIDIEIDGESTLFEVIKVAHSTNGGDSDLYVRPLGLTYRVVEDLCSKSD